MLKRVLSMIKMDILFSRAQSLASSDRLDEALIAFNQALLLAPNNSGLLLHKALTLSDKNEYIESVATLKKAIELNPNNYVYYLFLGRVHYDHKMYKEALRAFDHALSVDPKNLLVLCFRNLTVLTNGYDNKAFKLIKKELKNTNSEFQCRFMVFCESCLQNNIDFGQDSNNSADNFIPSGRIEHFLIDRVFNLQSLIYRIRYRSDIKKKSAYMRYLEGNKNLFMEDFKSAIDEFQKALDLFPEFEEAKEQLIEIYFNSKDYVQALAYLNQSKKYTDFMDSHNQIEGSMVNQSLKKQTRLGNDYIYRLLGIIYYQLHEYIKAIDNLNSALNSGLNNYEPPYYLGLCNIALGNNEEARLWFKKAVEKDGVEFFQKRLNEMEKTFKSSS